MSPSLRRPRSHVALAVLLVALAALSGCGSHAAHPPLRPLATPLTAAERACPAAADGHGSMGACAPPGTFHAVPPSAMLRLQASARITFPDRSNNDPTRNMAAIAGAGHPAIYLKRSQGTGFSDGWFVAQANPARARRMSVGGYDFVSTYSAAEAFFFVNELRLGGITRASARTMPPVLDVEFGSASRAGVQTMVNIVRRAYGRVMIYTGDWYWGPHLGCWWPSGVQAWLSGYPSAPVPCGLPRSLYVVHQFTDHGWDGAGYVDMNLWLGSTPGWRVFARTGASRATLERQLRAQLVWRAHLRRVLHVYRCRTVHRRQTRPVNCVLTLARGDAANRRIRALRAQIALA